MKTEFRYIKNFTVDGKPFRFIIDWDGQLILLNMTYRSDGWGDVYPLDMYHAVGADPGAKVYRQAIKIALNAIFTLKLKTFLFSTGGEEIRHSLYERLATRFETKYGYYCYRNGVVFKFYKIVD